MATKIGFAIGGIIIGTLATYIFISPHGHPASSTPKNTNAILKDSYSHIKGKAILLAGNTGKLLSKKETQVISDLLSQGTDFAEHQQGEAQLIVLMQKNGEWLEIHSMENLADIHSKGKYHTVKVGSKLHQHLESCAIKYGIFKAQ